MTEFMIDGDTLDYKGFTIEVHSDHHPSNPREDWDQFGTIWTFESRYRSPDKTPRNDPWESLIRLYCELSPRNNAYEHLCRSLLKSDWDEDIGGLAYAIQSDEDTQNRFWKKLDKLAVILPVYVYEHGERAYRTASFSCPWDSGQAGWTFASLAKVREEYSCKRVTEATRQKAIDLLKSELSTFDHWQRADVYGYVVKDPDGGEVDSCWGFYDADAEASGLLYEAKCAIDCEVEANRRAKLNRTKTLIRNRVPLELRA